MTWAAEMAVGLRTGVPWIMCKQDDAPDPIVSTLLIRPVFISHNNYLVNYLGYGANSYSQTSCDR